MSRPKVKRQGIQQRARPNRRDQPSTATVRSRSRVESDCAQVQHCTADSGGPQHGMLRKLASSEHGDEAKPKVVESDCTEVQHCPTDRAVDVLSMEC